MMVELKIIFKLIKNNVIIFIIGIILVFYGVIFLLEGCNLYIED